MNAITLTALLGGFALCGQPVAVSLVDTSRSAAAVASQMKSEQKQFIDALPDGSRLTIVAVGATLRRVVEGTLETTRRDKAKSIVDSLVVNDQNTALGEALDEALRIAAEQMGSPKSIWLFSDGQNRPILGSKFRGVPLNRILADLRVPDNVEVFIRLFGVERIISTNPHIHVLKLAPEWKIMYASRPSSRAAREPRSREILPVVFTLAGTITLFVVSGGWLLYRRSKRSNDLLAELLPSESPNPEPLRTPTARKGFLIFAEGVDQTITLVPGMKDVALIGDSLLADLYLPVCQQRSASFRIEGTPESPHITLRNDGSGDIEIGRRRIAPGVSMKLCHAPIEMRIGTQIVHCIPNSVDSYDEVTG